MCLLIISYKSDIAFEIYMHSVMHLNVIIDSLISYTDGGSPVDGGQIYL